MAETKPQDRISSITPESADAPEESAAALRAVVASARTAQVAWGRKSFRERGRHIIAIRNFVVENADRITAAIVKNTGKTRIDALSTEVISAAMGVDYYVKQAQRVLGRKRLRGGHLLFSNKVSYLERAPWGVVGIISPWNYPFAIPFHEVVMALMAGNAVVLKVATQSQDVGNILQEAVAAGGLPPGVFNTVRLPGSIAGDAFIQAGIDKLFFTGSVAVGKELMAKAADRLLPVSLELGGNDAMIVCRDADLVRAAGGAAWAGFSNCGQSCAGAERIFVEEAVYEPFLALLREKTAALRQGPDEGFNVDLGALSNQDQYRKIETMVGDALSKGARISARSQAPELKEPGLFYPAIILEGVQDTMAVMREEIFGPILAVMKVKDIDEAVARANASRLGLTASVWTKDRRKAHAIASRLEAGAVMINDHLMSHGLAETPWGGFKESGIGRTHGHFGLEEMTQPRVVIDDILPGVKKNMWWYPHGKDVYDGLKGVLDFLYARTGQARLRGMMQMARLFLRTFQR